MNYDRILLETWNIQWDRKKQIQVVFLAISIPKSKPAPPATATVMGWSIPSRYLAKGVLPVKWPWPVVRLLPDARSKQLSHWVGPGWLKTSAAQGSQVVGGTHQWPWFLLLWLAAMAGERSC